MAISTKPACFPCATGSTATQPWAAARRWDYRRTGSWWGEAIRRKPPSAELRPNQKDSDSLPDYDALDALLKALIQERQSGTTLVAAGHDPALVERVERMMKRAEFKRRQAAPLLKVSPQAFGSGWRLPIAAA